MAVQAQYPPNILLLNRNGQEGNDYSLQQPQSKVELLHQSQNLHNNENANSRQRGREDVVTNPSPNNIMNPMFPMQPHPQNFIELSQLHNQHQNVVSTGLGLSFGDQQKQRLQLHQQQHGCNSSSFLSEGFSSQVKQKGDEFDIFLHAQGEELMRTLAEKMQRHYQELLRKAEEAVARRLREKEAEVEKAMRRHAELEARAAQMSAEAQVWQAKAMAQEAAAASLQAQLQQTLTAAGSAGCRGGDDGGAGLPFAQDGGQAEDAESTYIDMDRVEVVESVAARAKCKGCRKRVVSVVVLPCRHLCICAECDSRLRACPICLTPKNSTVEVYLS
ncbi:hypothetical protein TanjilG_28073 [Lupinus angustifolius]|uniref:RING-type domain-containing protein n=1 Tax=Lupinus angustifolius TaxID=3871 RepID=A0A4P1RG63_LUPAN|nr:PREDICTED: BOI-related E3 ubiquitin-protein ligase 1-like [Lupinus angustifolius]OIW10322.1 hypothetical protein TanjilG_28073 [Lupinus angustifolius]